MEQDKKVLDERVYDVPDYLHETRSSFGEQCCVLLHANLKYNYSNFIIKMEY